MKQRRTNSSLTLWPGSPVKTVNTVTGRARSTTLMSCTVSDRPENDTGYLPFLYSVELEALYFQLILHYLKTTPITDPIYRDTRQEARIG